jgi:hypothetical protein
MPVSVSKIAVFGTQKASRLRAKAPVITSIGYSNPEAWNYALR